MPILTRGLTDTIGSEMIEVKKYWDSQIMGLSRHPEEAI